MKNSKLVEIKEKKEHLATLKKLKLLKLQCHNYPIQKNFVEKEGNSFAEVIRENDLCAINGWP